MLRNMLRIMLQHRRSIICSIIVPDRHNSLLAMQFSQYGPALVAPRGRLFAAMHHITVPGKRGQDWPS
jgi:hypothetical protein